MQRGYSFRPRAWILGAAAAACAAGIALGHWQTRRAEEKLALAEQWKSALANPPIEITGRAQTEDLMNRHVIATGIFDAAHTIYLANRNRGGRPGYEVVTPLLLSPSSAVLVQRGWVERGRRDELRVPLGVQRIEGLALARLPHALAPSAASSGNVRQNLEIAAYARETGLTLQPVVIQQRSDNRDGLARDWPAADFGADTHRAYALQWYSLAALAVLLGIVFSFRRVA